MYEWSDHANCINCRRGGKAYVIASAQHYPQEFVQLIAHEKRPEFHGHTIFQEGPIEKIVEHGLKRKVNRREKVVVPRLSEYHESIDIGACECGG
jgi:hypothetical protein